MSLRPITMPVRQPPEPEEREARGRTTEYDLLVELRERTIANSTYDPLRDADWWSVIDHTPRTARRAYQRVARLKFETVLPKGLWSIRAKGLDADRYVIVARFEGYRPWWVNASELAQSEEFAKVVESRFDEHPEPPEITGNPYGRRRPRSKHTVQDRKPS